MALPVNCSQLGGHLVGVVYKSWNRQHVVGITEQEIHNILSTYCNSGGLTRSETAADLIDSEMLASDGEKYESFPEVLKFQNLAFFSLLNVNTESWIHLSRCFVMQLFNNATTPYAQDCVRRFIARTALSRSVILNPSWSLWMWHSVWDGKKRENFQTNSVFNDHEFITFTHCLYTSVLYIYVQYIYIVLSLLTRQSQLLLTEFLATSSTDSFCFVLMESTISHCFFLKSNSDLMYSINDH